MKLLGAVKQTYEDREWFWLEYPYARVYPARCDTPNDVSSEHDNGKT